MIEADRPFSVYADGDPVAELPGDDSHPPQRAAGDRAARFGAVSDAARHWPRASGRRSRSPARPATCRGAPAAEAAPRSPGACSFAWRPTRSSAWALASRRARHVISATNGKTTTAGMLASALREAGRTPVHNRAGSNMSWGVATALLEQEGAEGLFEVDEAWLPRMVEALDPGLIVLSNLFRDQLDRYGELERLADEWAEMVAGTTGRPRPERRRSARRRPRAATRTSRGGPTSRTSGSRTPRRRCPASSTPTTPSTAAAAARRTRTSGPSSGTSATTPVPTAMPTGPTPDVAATRIELDGMRGSRVEVSTPDGPLELRLPLPGLYNVYNALAALSAALRLGVEPQRSRHWSRAHRGRVRAGRDRRGRGQAGLDPPDQEPRRRQRGDPHAPPRERAVRRRRGHPPVDRAQRPASPTAATSRGSGTPTSSFSPDRSRA